VTVGSVHGGSKHNIIPAEVDLQLTIRFFTDDVYRQIMAALKRITEGVAYSAGLTDEQLPVITVGKEYTPPVANDPDLVNRVASSISSVLGKENTILVDPSTVAEDFGRYGRTPEKVKIGLFWLGGANRARYDESILRNTNLPALHSQTFHPDFEPTYVTGVTSMTRAVIDLLQTR
jgi:hippurate hydrolase